MEEILKSKSKFLLVLGAPGTGKSYILKQLAAQRDPMSPYIIIAPSNAQCELIGGRTIYNLTNSPMTQLEAKKPFLHKHVLIDEVFCIKKWEMQVIINSLKSEKSRIIMFGDQYQIKQLSNDYFYDAVFEGKTLTDQMQVIELKQYHRCQSPRLQNLLDSYRLGQQPKFPPRRIDIQELLQRVLSGNFTVLVGTNERKRHFQSVIDKEVIRQDQQVYGKDGQIYRFGQTVYLLSEHGSYQQQGKILKHKKGIFQIQFEDSVREFQPYFKKNKMVYDFVPGDVITVNISQGKTISNGVIVDLESIFELGSYYVSVSRCQRYDQILTINQNKQPFEPDYGNYYVSPKQEPITSQLSSNDSSEITE